MLTGKELGEAIRIAIEKKKVTKVAVARHFHVKPPSIQDWMNRGVIAKDKLPALWAYFSDVVGPEHWGLNDWPGGKAVAEGVPASDIPADDPILQIISTRNYLSMPDVDKRMIASFIRPFIEARSTRPDPRAGIRADLDRVTSPVEGQGSGKRATGGGK